MPTMYRPGGVKQQFDRFEDGEKQGFHRSFQDMARAHKAANAPEEPAVEEPEEPAVEALEEAQESLLIEEPVNVEVGADQPSLRTDQD